MEVFTGSVAMVRHPDQEEKLWLLKWNPVAAQFEMVVAERLQQETFREGLSREIVWSLQLQQNRDFLISSMARLHIEAPFQLPRECHPRPAILEFYVVDLYGKDSRSKIAENPEVRWISNQEILAGHTTDAQPIDPQQVGLINQYELISAHA